MPALEIDPQGHAGKPAIDFGRLIGSEHFDAVAFRLQQGSGLRETRAHENMVVEADEIGGGLLAFRGASMTW